MRSNWKIVTYQSSSHPRLKSRTVDTGKLIYQKQHETSYEIFDSCLWATNSELYTHPRITINYHFLTSERLPEDTLFLPCQIMPLLEMLAFNLTMLILSDRKNDLDWLSTCWCKILHVGLTIDMEEIVCLLANVQR